MLVNEAKWFARRFAELGDAAVFPMLNVGSHHEEFRTNEQPWVDRYLFAPPRARGQKVVHTDIRPNAGVDLVGDLTDPAFLDTVGAMRFRSVFCSNLLEHVVNRAEIAACVTRTVEPGGYLFASVPNVFPYHPDPIDTMYRPGPDEFAALFPGTEPVRCERVRCGNLTTYMLARFLGSPGTLLKGLYTRRKQTVVQTEAGMSAAQWLPWLWRPFYQACVVLRKPS